MTIIANPRLWFTPNFMALRPYAFAEHGYPPSVEISHFLLEINLSAKIILPKG